MDHVCAVFPILPGKTEAARAFQRELVEKRMDEYDRSERRIGITTEHWFIATVNGGDQLIAYIESADFASSIGQFAASRDEFDMWFKREVMDATGVDFNNLPPDMKLPELVSSYKA